jgi:hypothetical protein
LSKSSQSVSWAPTIAITMTQSPKTSELATTSGDGAITYSVHNAGSTGCTVDS